MREGRREKEKDTTTISGERKRDLSERGEREGERGDS